jgi:hypothetical protein
MKQVHWKYQNHFVHYGGAGLDMLAPHTMGFRQEFTGGFQFDDVALHQSNQALLGQLAQRIHALSSPISLGRLFSSTCNTTPATSYMYNDVLANLVAAKEIVITATDGKPKRHARYMVDTDIVQTNPQSRLF